MPSRRDLSDKRICCCPADLKKICARRRTSAKASVSDIVAALTMQDEVQKILERHRDDYIPPPPKRRRRKRPRPNEDLMVNPSIPMRLECIRHCDPRPYKPSCGGTCGGRPQDYASYKQPPTHTREPCLGKSFYEDTPCVEEPPEEIPDECEIILTMPGTQKHDEDSASELEFKSPRVSGENINAQKVPLKTTRPPIPGKSGHELFKPRSGVILNPDEENEFNEPFYPILPMREVMPKKVIKTCARGGICNNPRCKRKKCRIGQKCQCQFQGAPRKIRWNSRCWSVRYARAQSRRRRRRPRPKPCEDEADQGGLDDYAPVEHPALPRGLKKGSFKTYSLTIIPCKKSKRGNVHFGILMASHNMYSDKFGSKSRGRQGLTISVLAYCLAFHYHPKQWSVKLLNTLLEEGDTWYQQCLEGLHDHSAFLGICEVLPYGKKQIVVLNKKRMLVCLGEPEIIGYAMSLDPTVYNLCRGLKAFFIENENRACVMMSRMMKVVIWRDKVCYYIFDPAGRDNRAYQNFAEGGAALITVKDLNSVAEILLTRSILEDQKFVLAPLKVLRMVAEKDDDDLKSEPELTQEEKAEMSYKILNPNLGIVNGNIHLGDISFEDAKYRQSLPIAISAITYAKISPPNTWYSKTVDKIIRLGNALYNQCAQKNVVVDLTVDNIPNEITLGPYTAELIIYRNRTQGQLFTPKACMLNIRTGLSDFFSRDYNSGILEFGNYNLAVWKQKDMYYLFDPYPRSDDGARAIKTGRACCFMLLNTDAIAEQIIQVWSFLPPTTPFEIHAFKVLRIKKKKPKHTLECTLSCDKLCDEPAVKRSRRIMPVCKPSGTTHASGDSKRIIEIMSVQTVPGSDPFTRKNKELGRPGAGPGGRPGAGPGRPGAGPGRPGSEVAGTMPKRFEEEKMADITSLVDSIAEDYLTPVPRKYRDLPPEEVEPKLADLDSPTVSVTQMIPPWPKPRDKSNEPEEPDPDPVPSPPPTPPPPIPPEGAEEEAEEEAMDEETMRLRMEEELRRRQEEEEARRRAEMLPPPIPPPPPTPLIEVEPPLAEIIMGKTEEDEMALLALAGDEAAELIEMMQPIEVKREVLLLEDAKKLQKVRDASRASLRAIGSRGSGAIGSRVSGTAGAPGAAEETGAGGVTRTSRIPRDVTLPVQELMPPVPRTKSEELSLPNNFTTLPDGLELIRGSRCIGGPEFRDQLPFASIMAIVMSYKYAINTWTPGIVDFITHGGLSLYNEKKRDIKSAPMYVLPRLTIGHQTYKVNVEVVTDGPTWQLENTLKNFYFPAYDRGIITTSHYSAAFFDRNGLYYLYDGSCCNALGVRNKDSVKSGKACLMRFNDLHQLVNRILANKDSNVEDQQFVISRIAVRATLTEPRYKLPDDYDYEEQKPRDKKSRVTIADEKKVKKPEETYEPVQDLRGYQRYGGFCRIYGTTCLPGDEQDETSIGPSHFACLVAMLMASMVPPRQWDPTMVDICIEKGLEIAKKAKSDEICPKRIIKNLIVLGKIVNVNIAHIPVINNNPNPTIGQYIRAVSKRMRYVIVSLRGKDKVNVVIVQSNGMFHLFDPFTPPADEESILDYEDEDEEDEDEEDTEQIQAASWTLYPDIQDLIARLNLMADDVVEPEFYTFELTSIRSPPRRTALAYKLSPAFRPEQNPNLPFLQRPPPKPLVDEKLYWLSNEIVPWSRILGSNELGIRRGTRKALWKDWDIETPGDLYSLWGTIHPTDERFPPENRGKQYLAVYFVALAITDAVKLDAWSSNLIDGIVISGDQYHVALVEKLGNPQNHEILCEDFDGFTGHYGHCTFTPKITKVIFGFVYNILPDRFNLSQALAYFFERYEKGILVSSMKNLAFGRMGYSYFMIDCQSHSGPTFCGGVGSAYILKCETLNRLIYVMTLTLNARGHNQQFHLYSIDVTLSDKPDQKDTKVSKDTPDSPRTSKSKRDRRKESRKEKDAKRESKREKRKERKKVKTEPDSK